MYASPEESHGEAVWDNQNKQWVIEIRTGSEY